MGDFSRITLRQSCIRWTEGNLASFDIMLDHDGQVLVEWGDGQVQSACAGGGLAQSFMLSAMAWHRIEHVYSKGCWQSEEMMKITVTSSEAAIVGFRSYSIDMDVHEIDCREAQTLIELGAEGVHSLNMDGCEALIILDCLYFKGIELDLGRLPSLQRLDCSASEHLKSLRLTGCAALEELDVRYSQHLEVITLPNGSQLRGLTTDDLSRIRPNCLNFMKSVLNKNKGIIKVKTYESESIIECR